MTERPASWRMPTLMEKLDAQVGLKPAVPAAAPEAPLPPEYWESNLEDPRATTGARARPRWLADIQHHALRISCRRCERRMAPKYHPTPLSGGDRKALVKELGKARAMANILDSQSAEMRAKGEAIIQQTDKLLCESWNERMCSDGEPIDPSPTIDQAVNSGFPWLEIRCAGPTLYTAFISICPRRLTTIKYGLPFPCSPVRAARELLRSLSGARPFDGSCHDGGSSV
jgi:hypothetical protein